MAIIYRTAGAWGAGKGSNLTPAEVDGNFYDHEGRIAAIESNPPSPNEILSITKVGTSLLVTMDDLTTWGPFEMPRPPVLPSITSVVSTSSHSLALTEANYYFRCTNAAGCTFPIPIESAIAFEIDTEIHFHQTGAAPVVLTDSSGQVTLNVPTGFAAQTAQQGAVMTAKKVASDEWDIYGWLATASSGSGGTGTA